MSSSSLPHENSKTMTARQSSSGPLALAKMAIGIWSNSDRQRPPPSNPTKTKHVRLITISVSHYCEKARWVLDMVEADESSPYYYTEDAHPPGLHSYEPLKASKDQASITPMIIYRDAVDGDEMGSQDDETKVMWESSEIVKTFMPSLYPAAIASETKDMEDDLGRRLGPSLRCIAYYYLLGDLKKYQTVAELSAADPRKMSNIEATLWGKFLPQGLAKGIWKSLNINKETHEASEKDIRALFQELSVRLDKNGGKYLMDPVGGKTSYGFTASDLTFASLAYPFLRPPQMKFWQTNVDDNPPELNALREELTNTKAGQHVLKMYADHRPTNTNGVVEMKGVDRNRTLWQWMFGE